MLPAVPNLLRLPNPYLFSIADNSINAAYGARRLADHTPQHYLTRFQKELAKKIEWKIIGVPRKFLRTITQQVGIPPLCMFPL